MEIRPFPAELDLEYMSMMTERILDTYEQKYPQEQWRPCDGTLTDTEGVWHVIARNEKETHFICVKRWGEILRHQCLLASKIPDYVPPAPLTPDGLTPEEKIHYAQLVIAAVLFAFFSGAAVGVLSRERGQQQEKQDQHEPAEKRAPAPRPTVD